MNGGGAMTTREVGGAVTDDHRGIGQSSRAEGLQVEQAQLDEMRAQVGELELALAVTSLVDARTGMASRNALLDVTQRELHRQSRYGQPVGVLVCRLSPADDAAHVSAVMQALVRSIDQVATWDEWCVGVLLDNLTPDLVPVVWERLADHVPGSACFAFPQGPVTADELLVAAENCRVDSGAIVVVDPRAAVER